MGVRHVGAEDLGGEEQGVVDGHLGEELEGRADRGKLLFRGLRRLVSKVHCAAKGVLTWLAWSKQAMNLCA